MWKTETFFFFKSVCSPFCCFHEKWSSAVSNFAKSWLDQKKKNRKRKICKRLRFVTQRWSFAHHCTLSRAVLVCPHVRSSPLWSSWSFGYWPLSCWRMRVSSVRCCFCLLECLLCGFHDSEGMSHRCRRRTQWLNFLLEVRVRQWSLLLCFDWWLHVCVPCMWVCSCASCVCVLFFFLFSFSLAKKNGFDCNAVRAVQWRNFWLRGGSYACVIFLHLLSPKQPINNFFLLYFLVWWVFGFLFNSIIILFWTWTLFCRRTKIQQGETSFVSAPQIFFPTLQTIFFYRDSCDSFGKRPLRKFRFTKSNCCSELILDSNYTKAQSFGHTLFVFSNEA